MIMVQFLTLLKENKMSGIEGERSNEVEKESPIGQELISLEGKVREIRNKVGNLLERLHVVLTPPCPESIENKKVTEEPECGVARILCVISVVADEAIDELDAIQSRLCV